MKTTIFISILSLMIVFSGSDCNGIQADISKTISGYTQTGLTGAIISQDNDDWRIQKAYIGKLTSLSPAYPNPTANGNITINFNFSLIQDISGISVSAQVEGSSSVIFITTLTGITKSGFTNKNFSIAGVMTNASGKLVRVYLSDPDNVLISYGDIKIP